MLKFYYASGSCALASHIALEEAGAEYEAVRISFAANEQRKPDYLAINPKGRVPALVTDRGVQILGGHGYIREHPVEMYMRNGRGFAMLTGLAIV